MLSVLDCVADCVWFAVLQATEWQRVRDQIDFAMTFAGSDFVDVHIIFSETPPQAS